MLTLNHHFLDIGDVILIRGEGTGSKIIANATGGHFSHACIAASNNFIVESEPGCGVVRIPTMMVRVQHADDIKVLRLKNISDGIKAKIAKIVPTYIGGKYNKKGAVLFHPLGHEGKPYEFFCSQLVASIFRNAGLQIFKMDDYKISPNSFLKVAAFIDVTKKATTETTNIVDNLEYLRRHNSYKSSYQDILCFRKKIEKRFHNFFTDRYVNFAGIKEKLSAIEEQKYRTEADDYICTLFDEFRFEQDSTFSDDPFSESEINRLINLTKDKIKSELSSSQYELEIFNFILCEELDLMRTAFHSFEGGINFSTRITNYLCSRIFAYYISAKRIEMKIKIMSYRNRNLTDSKLNSSIASLHSEFRDFIYAGVRIEKHPSDDASILGIHIRYFENRFHFAYSMIGGG